MTITDEIYLVNLHKMGPWELSTLAGDKINQLLNWAVFTVRFKHNKQRITISVIIINDGHSTINKNIIGMKVYLVKEIIICLNQFSNFHEAFSSLAWKKTPIEGYIGSQYPDSLDTETQTTVINLTDKFYPDNLIQCLDPYTETPGPRYQYIHFVCLSG